MPVISENFASLVDLDPVLTEIFYQHYEAQPTKRDLLFRMLTSSKAKETDQRLGTFSDPTELDGKVEYETPEADYEVEYTPIEFARGFQITRKMLDDMQYNDIFDKAEAMAVAFARKQEKDAAGVFNDAFTAGATAGYDAVALCSTTHPRSEADDTAVINYLELALTSDNLETAITTHQGLGDDRGEEATTMPNLLVVPRALRRKGRELTESPLHPESAENTINVHSQELQLMEWPYLTDSTAWFIVDLAMSRKFLKWYTRIATEFAVEDSFDTFIRKFRGYMRYSKGWSDFRFVVGCKP